ncbi:retention module-containing protein, partial [Aliagarivorans marinus]|uniref:retention module-containing protein n=1 Tax=Aliagarivorans marinus TaxID=561965 RepID=UPI000478B77B
MEQSIVSNNATIVSIEGTAFAVAPDGSLRELQPGDQLLAGEMLITGEGTQIGFYYSDDQYELGELSVTQLPEDGVAEPGQTLSAQNEVDVEALQAAILQGVDPTELFEATAAGGAPAAGGGGPGAGNGGFISISRSGAETIAEAGFDTESRPSDVLAENNSQGTPQETTLNRAPSAEDLAFVIEEDSTLIFTDEQLLQEASDLDGDTLSVSEVVYGGNDGTFINNGDGTYSFTPSESFNGAVDLSFVVSDGIEFANANINVTITPVNDAPDAVDDAASGDEGSTITVLTGGAISVLANDT